MDPVDHTLDQSESDREERRLHSQAPGVPQLPGYRLERQLGEGSFGVVWAGVQIRTGLKVAVKVLRTGELDLPGFQREVGRLREVSEHPHVVTLLDADLKHDPPFFVMPWLVRGSLAAFKDRSEVGRVVDWFRQIAEGLQFTHEKGLLHCDLKPSNLLLDEEGRVRLVDFGQAYARGETRGALGTLGFMAPEQAGGPEEEVGSAPSVRWDLYALGATIYYLLTGRCPRLSEEERTALSTLHSGAALTAYRQHLRTNALIPLRRLNPQVDQDLASIVEACLELDPARRTASAAEVLTDLDSRQRGEPLLCRRPWSLGYRLRKLVRKPVVATALLSAALLLGGGVASYRQIRASYQDSLQANRALTREQQRSEQLVARLMTDRGLMAEQEGNTALAVLWWAAALRHTPRDQALRCLLHTHPISGPTWTRTEGSPREVWVSPEGGRLLAAGPSGAQLLERSSGRELGQLDHSPYQVRFSPDGQWLALVPDSMLAPVLRKVGSGQDVPLPGCGPAEDLAFLQDGSLAVLEREGRVSFWEVPSGRRKRHFGVPPVELGQLSPAAGLVAVVGGNSLEVRRTDDGTLLRRLPLSGSISWIELSPSGDRLVCLGYEQSSYWELPSGQPLTPPWGQRAVGKPAFSPGGDLLAVQGDQGELLVYSTREGSERASLQVGEWQARPVFPPGQIVLGTRAGELVTLDASSGRVTGRLPVGGAVEDVALGPDGRWLALVTGGSRPRLQVRTVTAFQPTRRVALGRPVTGLAFTPTGQLLVASDQALLSWAADHLEVLARASQRPLDLLQVSRDSRFAVACNERESVLVDLQRRQEVLRHPGALVLSPSGDRCLLLDGRTPGTVHLFNGRDNPLQGVLANVWGGFSPDGGLLALAPATNQRGPGLMEVRNGDGLGARYSLDLPGPAFVPVFSGDGTYLASTDVSGALVVSMARDGKKLFSQPDLGPGATLWPVFNPRREQLAVSSRDGLVHLLSMPSGQEPFPALRHPPGVSGVAIEFSADGTRLATCAPDRAAARAWQADTGLPLTPWLQAGQAVLSPDGEQLVTGYGEEVCWWSLRGEAGLTPEELQRRVERATGLRLEEATGAVHRLEP